MSDDFVGAGAGQVPPMGPSDPLPVTTSAEGTPTGAIINGRSYAPEELERLVDLAGAGSATGPLVASVSTPASAQSDPAHDASRFK